MLDRISTFRTYSWTTLVALGLAACSHAPDSYPRYEADASAIAAGKSTGGGAAAPPAPSTSSGIAIASLTSTTAAITDSESETNASHATFIAVVTDPHGSVAGGTLSDDTGVTYGAFAAGAEKSTFTLELSWRDISQTRALEFAPPGDTRTFIATFHGDDGASVSATITVRFECSDPSHFGACQGVCVDFWKDSTCGACGTTCNRSLGETCLEGRCVTPRWASACYPSPAPATCNELCASNGRRCIDACNAAEQYPLGVDGMRELDTDANRKSCGPTPVSSGSCTSPLPASASCCCA